MINNNNRILKPGDIIDDVYLVEQHIGNGSFGNVYAVKDMILQRPYVLKM